MLFERRLVQTNEENGGDMNTMENGRTQGKPLMLKEVHRMESLYRPGRVALQSGSKRARCQEIFVKASSSVPARRINSENAKTSVYVLSEFLRAGT